MVNKDFHYIT